MLFDRLVDSVTNLWQRQSLRQTLSFCLISMTIFPLLLTMVITEQKSEKILTRIAFDHNRDIAERIAEDIDQMFSEKIKMLRIIANADEMKSMQPDRQIALLKAIARANADVKFAIVADTAGNQVARSDGRVADDTIKYLDRYYFQEIIQGGETVVSDILIGKSTGDPGIVIAEPIKDENQQLVGVLALNVELRAIVDRITNIKIGENGYAYLVNADGRILLHPDQGMAERREDVSYLNPVKAVMDKQTGLVEYEYKKQKRWAAFSYIPQTGWGLIVQQPTEEALADVSAVKRTTMMITLLAALIASLIGIAVTRMVTKPISEIAKAAARLSDGDLDARSHVRARNEIGQLATTFNSMADKLSRRTSDLLESEGKYRSLVDNINIGIYRETGDDKSVIVYANPALAEMLGYESVDEMSETTVDEKFWNLEDLVAVREAVEREGAVKNREIQLRRKDGVAIWCSMMLVKHYNDQKDTFCLDSMIEDITERKIAQEKLLHAHAELELKVAERTRKLTVANEELSMLSLQDGLTRMANRRYFDESLEREIQRAKREQASIALIILDVDFFKLYNDTYGHVAGDECLRRIASALRGITKRGTDLAARYGGEEFAIILPNTDQTGAVKVGERILTQVRELAISHEVSSFEKIVTVSIGIAVLIPGADVTPERLIIAADQALYQAKHSGRNQLQLVSEIGQMDR